LGEVKKVEVSTVVDSKSSAKPTRESLYTKNIIVIIVEDESGKIIKKKVDESPANPNSEYVRYKVGDMVLHLHGTGVTVVLPRNNERTCNCVMCGFSNDLSNEVCSHCGYQLIKYDMGKKTY